MTTKVTPDVATSFFRKNAIINGDFNVWQRGTSFAAIANGAYSADRWVYTKDTTGAAHTVSRSTDVPTVAQAGRLFNYSFLVDCTTADAAVAAGDIVSFQHRVEGYNWLPLAQRAITLSFWVKATKTGTYCAALVNSGADRSCVKEYTVSVADTWEKKTLTFPASPSAGTWDYTTGIGVRVTFTLMAGTTYQGTADAYQSSQIYATANQVNACDSTSNDFRIAGVQLEPGSVATDFEQRTFNDELALCQRYYCKTFDYATTPGDNVSTAGAFMCGNLSTGNYEPSVRWQFPVSMRAAPTIVSYNPSTGAGGHWSDGGGGTAGNTRAIFTGTESTIIDNSDVTIAGSSAWRIHATASAEL